MGQGRVESGVVYLAMCTISLLLFAKRISSEICVFDIQKLCSSSSGIKNSIPPSSGIEARCMSPLSMVESVSAISISIVR